MTNAELITKIKAEIERLKDENRKIKCQANERYCSGYDDAFYDLVHFLDALESASKCKGCNNVKGCVTCVNGDLWAHYKESEKPMNLDLEIEVEDYVEQRWQFAEDLNAAVPVYLYDMTLNELKDCARHFAKWGAERQKEQDDRLVDIIYQQGIEKGKDEIRKTLKRKEEK